MKKFLLINILILSVSFAFAQEIDVNDTTIYHFVDIKAEFVGGEKALIKWLNDNIIFPPECAEMGIQGRTYVKFVVEKDGSITNAEVVRGIHPILDREAIRLVKAMPKWEPAIKDNKIVRSYFILPVSFILKQ